MCRAAIFAFKSMTDDTNKKDAAREKAMLQERATAFYSYLVKNWNSYPSAKDVIVELCQFIQYGYDAGYADGQAHADQSAAAWVKFDGQLPEAGNYWLTLYEYERGRIWTSAFTLVAGYSFPPQVVAYMPIHPPPPYQDQNDAAQRDGEEGK
jgi:hypothetical protein